MAARIKPVLPKIKPVDMNHANTECDVNDQFTLSSFHDLDLSKKTSIHLQETSEIGIITTECPRGYEPETTLSSPQSIETTEFSSPNEPQTLLLLPSTQKKQLLITESLHTTQTTESSTFPTSSPSSMIQETTCIDGDSNDLNKKAKEELENLKYLIKRFNAERKNGIIIKNRRRKKSTDNLLPSNESNTEKPENIFYRLTAHLNHTQSTEAGKCLKYFIIILFTT